MPQCAGEDHVGDHARRCERPTAKNDLDYCAEHGDTRTGRGGKDFSLRIRMASDRGGHPGNGPCGAVHLLTPAAEFAALREPTGVDLMDRHQLNRYEPESRRTLKKGFSHFLSPQLQVLIKEKPRVALSEKAEFGELLAEEPSASPWPTQELSVELLRRSFLIRKRVAVAGVVAANADEGEEGPPVPPDVPMANQTTNKFSPAYAKKVYLYVSTLGAVCSHVLQQHAQPPQPGGIGVCIFYAVCCMYICSCTAVSNRLLLGMHAPVSYPAFLHRTNRARVASAPFPATNNRPSKPRSGQGLRATMTRKERGGRFHLRLLLRRPPTSSPP